MKTVFDTVADQFTMHRKDREAMDRQDLLHRAAAYRRLNVFRPHPVSCLEDTLSAMFFLDGYISGLGFHVGVRPDPFLAHAWLELDGIVLNDSLRRVEDYREICVVR